MADIIARIPEAADLTAETTRNGLRFRVMQLVRLMQEAANAGQSQITYEAPFLNQVITVFTNKGYTISHDGTAYSISW
jgi:hypothetical protein